MRTVKQLKWTMEQVQLGRVKRGGGPDHDYLTEFDLEVIALIREFGHLRATGQISPAPFYLKKKKT